MRFLIFLLLAAPLFCQTLTGTAVKIVDGDTFDLKDGSEVFRIRLHGVDTPERGRPYADSAANFLKSLLQGEEITAIVINQDRYKRSVADVYVSDSVNVAYKLTRAGWAKVMRRYINDGKLDSLEANAKKNKLGLWK